MATISVTSSPVQINDGTGVELQITNTGTADVRVGKGTTGKRGQTVRPGGFLRFEPEGSAVYAASDSSSTLNVVTSTAPVVTNLGAAVAANTSQLATNTAAIAALPATYAHAALERRTAAFRGQVAVAGRVVWPGTGGLSNGTATYANYRSEHTTSADCYDLRLVYVNAYGHETTAVPNAVVFSAGLEVAGTVYPVTFAGRFSATVDPGGTLISDPIGVKIAKGTQVFARTNVSIVNAGDKWATGEINRGSDTGATGTGTNSDLSKSGSITGGSIFMVRPVIIGTPVTWPALYLGCIGDSITAGTGDNSSLGAMAVGAAGTGFIRRGVNDAYPLMHMGTGGSRYSNFANANRALRGAFLSGCSDVIVEEGINDFSNSEALATVQAAAIEVWTFVQSKAARVWETTKGPHVTTTDGYGTLSGQTAFSPGESVRVAYNGWLRDGAPMHYTGGAWVVDVVGATGSVSRAAYYSTAGALVTAASGPSGHPVKAVIEIADVYESARDSGKFSVTAVRTVTDGAITSASNVFTSATAAFTSADVGKNINVVGAGTAGALLTQPINVVTNSTTATLGGTAGTTVTGATAQIGALTTDGLHPATPVHIQMAATLTAMLPVIAAAAAA